MGSQTPFFKASREGIYKYSVVHPRFKGMVHMITIFTYMAHIDIGEHKKPFEYIKKTTLIYPVVTFFVPIIVKSQKSCLRSQKRFLTIPKKFHYIPKKRLTIV